MTNKTMAAALLALAFGGAAQAQTVCICNGGSGTQLTTAAAIETLLSNKMVCATAGGDQWQEWHNGTSSGPVVDYKLGPGHPVDPSTTVGSYQIVEVANNPNISKSQRAAGATIRYTYGAQTYTYGVCQTGVTYAFCGAAFGGRDITGAKVAATNGLQPCSGVVAANRSTSSKKQ